MLDFILGIKLKQNKNSQISKLKKRRLKKISLIF